MASFIYDWNKNRLPMGRELCATVAHLLDAAGIPSVLWGKYMIFAYEVGMDPDIDERQKRLEEAEAKHERTAQEDHEADVARKTRGEPNPIDPYGYLPPIPHERHYIPKYDNSIAFIIPDDRIDDARDALVLASFPLCSSGCVCFDWKTHEMVPRYHFLGESGNTADSPVLKLFCRSDLLFRFPDPGLASPHPDDPWFMLTNDSRLPPDDVKRRGVNPEGRFDAALYPIKIPTPEKLYEALILLRCRDKDYHSHSDGSWTYWSNYLARNLVKTGRIDISQVGDLYRAVIESDLNDRSSFWDGEPKLLRAQLRKLDALPHPLPDRCPHDLYIHRLIHTTDEYGKVYKDFVRFRNQYKADTARYLKKASKGGGHGAQASGEEAVKYKDQVQHTECEHV
ncbi:hypothetical protein BO94DRAFT_551178 [Aspergillus sclerotioniger CBS 115572]|uniref:Uncharacterized protein n=1 Tax=Aspergillus sclerotioniger CBS 115572 TaxID=1450535 RepID=A0A317V3T1_9EURO|nr:hypothetical protein BO94DRAFT_551178 [Aspergillus sclerotioniger CBS 115572]PWY68001.1 hypothetical protein BO94DRAFT_551178 [Aspergillus sclerotioniger CBS 115572]